MSKPRTKADPRFDRLGEAFKGQPLRKDPPWQTEDRRGALDLAKDGSEHRKYHSLFEDLQN